MNFLKKTKGISKSEEQCSCCSVTENCCDAAESCCEEEKNCCEAVTECCSEKEKSHNNTASKGNCGCGCSSN